MDARQPHSFEPTRHPLFDRAQRGDGERPVARLKRVRAAAELAECCCPDECLVDHDN